MVRKRGGTEVFRITGARQGLAEDVRGRQRRYVISMSVRTLAVIATVALWNVQRPVAIVTLVLGVLLPYVAVVIANGGRENGTSLPSAHLAPPARTMIAPPAEPVVAETGAAATEGDRPSGP
ncbi:membrane protein [Streptomyces scopuliridis RB72]|uniref:Membrane protein n=1 Tax=Streptomyces scopuliridis RB72 TaxID=1440053 RepID=A0A2T7T8N3_9ACTN|nr:membrane protein [Streptomyces scopuliridis RB72]